ncbi:type II toxin-antitoxin system RelE/ParE family toxin [Streptomyces sp. AV19]|uniref:type II toxin-antitoxin system RelE family toxin n=1 Tax=Streptomyces sp. AV19 TaxID=2793068 RepID=UPI0018FEB71F|nr:type II toxin-antitoxin system RelE/ParE family toxin [Streptomyces sp. AV19]MBH1933625.1 type II toxin-antitoxin system RelE/ParE family toxin [Streptomyces sp. AV19]MDG4535869.1 type II toxin-antitoxin system RelE/ParE family toxin [Streptomyces sp. AV19]
MRALRQKDGDAVKPYADAINALATNPRPADAARLGGTNTWRLHVGRYRALYEIDGPNVAVTLLLIGSTPVRP